MLGFQSRRMVGICISTLPRCLLNGNYDISAKMPINTPIPQHLYAPPYAPFPIVHS
jgi:hypothetical protein